MKTFLEGLSKLLPKNRAVELTQSGGFWRLKFFYDLEKDSYELLPIMDLCRKFMVKLGFEKGNGDGFLIKITPKREIKIK